MTRSAWRFVAGAVCPQCKAVDSVRVRYHGERSERDCVDCGFHEQEEPQAAGVGTFEPHADGRLGAPDLLESGERPVRIIGPDDKIGPHG